jgi:hypothetical protein
MKFICPGAGCGAMYEVTADQVGKSFACQQCGATLVVEAKGLRLAGGGGSRGEPPPAPRPASRTSGEIRRSSVSSGNANGPSFLLDWATWLLGSGALLTVFFLLNPVIDRAKSDYRQAEIAEGNQKQEAARADMELKFRRENEDADKKDRDFNDKIREEIRKNPNPPADERKEREDRIKEHNEKTTKEREKRTKEQNKKRDERRIEDRKWEDKRAKLRMEAYEYETSVIGRRAFYTWGMMIGFFCLAVAAVGYLRPSQPLIRRIVGAIIICALAVLIFIAYLSLSMTTFTRYVPPRSREFIR